jgi:recombination protein RecT
MSKKEITTNQPVIVQYMDKYKDQIAAALPQHMTSDRMARICTTEFRKTPALLKCNPKSLFGAVIQAAQLGLEPGSALGHCYLIPYKQDVQLQIGYKGMLDLARRSGNINSISARSVRANDDFTYSFGLEDKLEHTPASGDRGDITHFYAVAKLRDGGSQFEVLERHEVDAIRDGSQAGKRGPWVTHYEEMGKKTAIRRLFKYLPVSIEIQSAVAIDEQADANIPQQNDSVLQGEWEVIPEDADGAPPPNSGTTNLKDRLGDSGDGAPDADNGVTIEGEQIKEEASPSPGEYTKGSLLTLVSDATSPDDLDYIRQLNKEHLSGTDKTAVTKAIGDRFAEIQKP